MRYFSFVEMKDSTRKTKQFYVGNLASGEVLGYISFFPQWRKYVFLPDITKNVVFDVACLLEIVNFLNKVNQDYQKEMQLRKQQLKEKENV